MESDREFEHLKLEANRGLEEMKLQSNRELEKLKLLFDYTKFHIGLYTTVATIFGGSLRPVVTSHSSSTPPYCLPRSPAFA